ncbi:transcription factor Adf-1-like [Perca flavescens]|uniref:transcription factor Adf-1-like n=1 Tax=Perca flavescens TaxID=8167 RepID=UPI00106E5041|nr:transcription factor Adf-1-like [Perca flavescens]
MRGEMNVELLVSSVSEHKALYDKRDSDYKHLDKRELLWSGIAEQMGLDVEEVKQKWKSLRDTYTRKKREDDCRSGQAAKNKNPWKCMKVMEFLATSTEFRSVHSNISPENMDEEVDQVVVQKEVSDSEEAPASTSPGSSFSSQTVTRSTVNKRKQPETPDFLDRYLLSKEARASEKEERREQRREQQNNDNYLFALGLIPAPRRLSAAVRFQSNSKYISCWVMLSLARPLLLFGVLPSGHPADPNKLWLLYNFLAALIDVHYMHFNSVFFSVLFFTFKKYC